MFESSWEYVTTMNWSLRIIGWAPISSNTILGVCPPTWIVDSVLSTMATIVVMEVLSLSTTFGNEWDILWREWLSTITLLNNKSTSEVLLAPFWYVNVKSEVGEPTSLTMLELVTKLQMPSVTREPTECFSKVLDGTPITCGSRIGKGLDVVFRVSFSITIMSLMLNFKS